MSGSIEHREFKARITKCFYICFCQAMMLTLIACANASGSAAFEPMTPTTDASASEPAATTSIPSLSSKVKPQVVSLNVFAAASLTDAFNEIGQSFQANHPDVTVMNNYAGSQQLAQQINQGAPADVFASANMVQMTAVITTGEVISGSQQIFARNRLVVVLPKGNPGKIAQLQDLAKPGLKIVLADQAVPVGNYALTFLDKASKDPAFGSDYKANVLKNVVSYENDVKAVLAKVQLGEADAGVVYTTDAASADPGKVSQLAIPDSLNVIAVYPIAPIQSSPNLETAKAFVDFVLSPTGQAILAKYGFMGK